MKTTDDRRAGPVLFRPRDVILIAALAFAAAALYFAPRLFAPAPRYAVAAVRGEEFTRIDLGSVSDEIMFDLNGAKIAVGSGGARVTQSDCPDKVCVRTGEISSPGEVIACVPNGVTVYIEGGPDGADAVAY